MLDFSDFTRTGISKLISRCGPLLHDNYAELGSILLPFESFLSVKEASLLLATAVTDARFSSTAAGKLKMDKVVEFIDRVCILNFDCT